MNFVGHQTRMRYIGVALACVLGAIIVPNFQAARARGYKRDCHQLQALLRDALKMYAEDKKVDRAKLDTTVFAKLCEGGYLLKIQDPGFGSDSLSHFQLDPRAPLGVRCTEHGAAEVP